MKSFVYCYYFCVNFNIIRGTTKLAFQLGNAHNTDDSSAGSLFNPDRRRDPTLQPSCYVSNIWLLSLSTRKFPLVVNYYTKRSQKWSRISFNQNASLIYASRRVDPLWLTNGSQLPASHKDKSVQFRLLDFKLQD